MEKLHNLKYPINPTWNKMISFINSYTIIKCIIVKVFFPCIQFNDPSSYVQFPLSHFLPLRLAVRRARDLAVSVLPVPCGVLGTPNVGAAAGDANGLPGMPLGPGAKLKPLLGVGVAGAALRNERNESIG